jgi:hypothetical protein
MSESTTILLRRIEDLFIIGLSEADDFSGNKMPMLPLYRHSVVMSSTHNRNCQNALRHQFWEGTTSSGHP